MRLSANGCFAASRWPRLFADLLWTCMKFSSTHAPAHVEPRRRETTVHMIYVCLLFRLSMGQDTSSPGASAVEAWVVEGVDSDSRRLRRQACQPTPPTRNSDPETLNRVGGSRGFRRQRRRTRSSHESWTLSISNRFWGTTFSHADDGHSCTPSRTASMMNRT